VDVEKFVDAHSHVWTPDVAHYPLAEGFKVENMNPKSFTAEELLATCRPSGVGRVNLIQMSFYRFDNRYMLDMIKLYPDRLVGTAIVDPLGEVPDQAMLGLKPKGVRAFRIAPNFSKLPAARWLEPPGYAAMFDASSKSGLALSCLINPDAFAEVDRMARRFPEATVIIDHLGRVGAGGTIEPAEVDALCALAKHPRVFIKVGGFYALGKKSPPYLDLAPLIRRVVQSFGAERCMWESDSPFQVVRGSYADSIDLIRNRLDFLTADQKDWLLWKTADRVLFRA
jgi:predicted TIM-barrel fold metal-dependent hydrolase